MSEKKMERYKEKFKREAVERMKTSPNVSALSKELGVSRRILYEWKTRRVDAPRPERNLRRENSQLKKMLAEKSLQIDFFKGALRRIGERKSAAGTGAIPSTRKSGK